MCHGVRSPCSKPRSEEKRLQCNPQNAAASLSNVPSQGKRSRRTSHVRNLSVYPNIETFTGSTLAPTSDMTLFRANFRRGNVRSTVGVSRATELLRAPAFELPHRY